MIKLILIGLLILPFSSAFAVEKGESGSVKSDLLNVCFLNIYMHTEKSNSNLSEFSPQSKIIINDSVSILECREAIINQIDSSREIDISTKNSVPKYNIVKFAYMENIEKNIEDFKNLTCTRQNTIAGISIDYVTDSTKDNFVKNFLEGIVGSDANLSPNTHCFWYA